MDGGKGRERGERERGRERESVRMHKSSKFEVTGCCTMRTERRLYIPS
jgi:hypothetical protein